jgi:hypothetical protein
MRAIDIGRLLVVLLCVVAVLSATVCLADGPIAIPGDPTDVPPGCTPPEPTPVVLSGLVILLVTVMSQTWL